MCSADYLSTWFGWVYRKFRSRLVLNILTKFICQVSPSKIIICFIVEMIHSVFHKRRSFSQPTLEFYHRSPATGAELNLTERFWHQKIKTPFLQLTTLFYLREYFEVSERACCTRYKLFRCLRSGRLGVLLDLEIIGASKTTESLRDWYFYFFCNWRRNKWPKIEN